MDYVDCNICVFCYCINKWSAGYKWSIFFGGYIITKLGFNDGKKRNTLFSAILLIIGSCAIRVFGKIVFDGSWLYEDVFAILCRLALAFGIIKACRWLNGALTSRFNSIMTSTIMNWLDKISVYVYCSHGLFITGGLSMLDTNIHYVALTLLVYICSFAAATIAFIVFEPLGQKIRNLIKTV